MKRIIGIGAVWGFCSLAWVILGSTLLVRSEGSEVTGDSDVQQLWGPPTEQLQPTASYRLEETVEQVQTETDTDGTRRQVTREVEQVSNPVIPLTGSDIEAQLALEHRQRGLNWYPTYTVDLTGRYRFENPTDEPQEVTFRFPLSRGMGLVNSAWRSYSGSGESAVFDGFSVRDASGELVPFEIGGEAATWTATMAPGATTFEVAYQSRGTQRWQYRMAEGSTRITDFHLSVETDFDEVDFPAGTVSPTEHGETSDGWRGQWDFDSSIASRPIGIEMPQRLNPGPLAARITFFAPVGMLFFFFVVGILSMARKVDLHPMHYFFISCSFFAFHLLFAYLVDHLAIGASFSIAAGVSVLLVVSYARLFTGWRFALQHIGISQLLYLVLFSYTFMWEGFTGLAITVGAVMTLFVMMQITGRKRWGKSAAKGDPSTELPTPTPETKAGEASAPAAF
ncbi:MAG: inner membrane CreD family protein [Sandaracinaceae bacterium]